jgi:hypothetical protein
MIKELPGSLKVKHNIFAYFINCNLPGCISAIFLAEKFGLFYTKATD